MRISLAEAQDHLAELVRRAEAGDEVVLTQVGHPDIRLVPQPVEPALHREGFLEAVAEIQRSAAAKLNSKFDAARSADFLYDEETGLPK